ncbi:SAM-dependent methyltransferase [uncultured Bacteroides sp.]|uniref:THUMP-like domain-containing protein n=1 Tax=uncultured Bacteroides sp. TaxID=162156 RepID=UPI002AAC3A24|nr:SAM-dependent methyltransferase [uncultured Bacteroides sp.]
MEISQETLAFINTHRYEDVRELALRATKFPGVDMSTAITQIAGRQIATLKIPSWSKVQELRYPNHLPLEQCSSEATARYKASLVEGKSLVDLTGGFGIDCAFLSSRFEKIIYVEQQESLCKLAIYNYHLLHLDHIQVKHADAISFLEEMEAVDCIFIDPARRNEHGGKTIAIEDCTPDVSELQYLLLNKARRILIKLSPMLDITKVMHAMPHTSEIHIVSVNNECKELLLLVGKELIKDPLIQCVNLQNENKQIFSFKHSQEQESNCVYEEDLGEYLYEPNASIMKAGAFKYLASVYKVNKLHPNSHLYTSNILVRDFPGRVFRVADLCSFNKKEFRKRFTEIKKANISVRNFPASVAEIRKRLNLLDGGETYFFATTLNSGKKVLINCTKCDLETEM